MSYGCAKQIFRAASRVKQISCIRWEAKAEFPARRRAADGKLSRQDALSQGNIRSPEEGPLAPVLKLRLDANLVGGSSVMKSNSPPWVWVAFVLALLTICYVVMPLTAVQHAAALVGWG